MIQPQYVAMACQDRRASSMDPLQPDRELSRATDYIAVPHLADGASDVKVFSPENTAEVGCAISVAPSAAVIESTAAPVEARPRVRTHIAGFELIRILSAFNVVTFHVLAISNGLVGRGSVAAFVIIAGALPAMRPGLGPFGRFAGRRATRILTPWFFWSAVYGVLAGARYLRSGVVPPWDLNWLAIGTAIHLWFFVFIFVAGLGIWWALHFLKPVRPDRASLGVLACAAPLIVIEQPLVTAWDPPSPFGLWTLCFPALLIGLALGLACRDDDERRRTRSVVIAGIVTMAAGIAAAFAGSFPILVSYGIPSILIPAALLLPIRVGPVVRAFANLSMGIYTTHPLVLLALRSFAGDSLPVVVSAPLVFLTAAGLSALIRKMPGGTWVA